jgi:hypothetical protein
LLRHTYSRNKAHPEDNRVGRHETVTVNEPPSGLSIFSEIDYKRRGQMVEEIPPNKFRKMRHYIMCNCDEDGPYVEQDTLLNIIYCF